MPPLLLLLIIITTSILGQTCVRRCHWPAKFFFLPTFVQNRDTSRVWHKWPTTTTDKSRDTVICELRESHSQKIATKQHNRTKNNVSNTCWIFTTFFLLQAIENKGLLLLLLLSSSFVPFTDKIIHGIRCELSSSLEEKQRRITLLAGTWTPRLARATASQRLPGEEPGTVDLATTSHITGWS